MKKTISLVLSLVLLLSLFGCSNSKYSKYSKSFLDLFDTASSVTAYDISQSEFDKKYEELMKDKAYIIGEVVDNHEGVELW